MWMGVMMGVMGCKGEVQPAKFTVTMENISAPGSQTASDSSAFDIMLAPGLMIVAQPGYTLFNSGDQASEELEIMAEDGDPAPLKDTLTSEPMVRLVEVIGSEDAVTYDDTPVIPGDVVDLTFIADPGELIGFAMMYGESNDVFLAFSELALFDEDGVSLSGDLTAQVRLYDAGTELNEEPRLRSNQPMRQENPGDGEAEDGAISELLGADSAGYTYPDIPSYLSLKIASEPVPE